MGAAIAAAAMLWTFSHSVIASEPAAKAHPAIKTVFLIVMENQNWSAIKGNRSAPYINGTVLPRASHAEQYYNPPGIHPSLPNYLWLEAGTNFGILDDGDPAGHLIQSASHLATLLDRAHISWKAYQEGINGKSCPTVSAFPYATKHNPFVYFANVKSSSSYCTSHQRPFTQLASDLRKNRVPRYSFITPNLCHDMHDACSPVNDGVKQGDTWLKNNLPVILHSRAYRAGGAVFLVWDEGEHVSDGPIGMIVISRYARGHGFSNRVHYTHSSTLRTLEEIFGVRPMLGDARHANDLRALFTTFP